MNRIWHGRIISKALYYKICPANIINKLKVERCNSLQVSISVVQLIDFNQIDSVIPA